MRDVVFLSHANPEDNLFTQWLALRLAAEGYQVWSDLTQLLGGERFWKDIETAIRERTAKFVFVVSRSSNQKRGPLQELQVASNVERDQKLQDFVIPLLVDDLPPRDMNIQVIDRNAIAFQKRWAEGLAVLLAKLEKDQIPKVSGAGPSAVSAWWKEAFGTARGIELKRDEYLSNRFRIVASPANVFVHHCSPVLGDGPALWEFPFPAVRVGATVVSFAGADQLASGLTVERTEQVDAVSLRTAGLVTSGIAAAEGHRVVSQLFRVAWERKAKARGLRSHQFASRRTAWYFTKRPQEKKRKVFFQGSDGKQRWRVMVGRARGHWYHFAVSASVLFEPYPVFAVQPHVVFSDDGGRPWESADRLARTRRSACKNWWNDVWRDRTCATVQFLADAEATIKILVGERAEIVVERTPEVFVSPVSYADAVFEELLSTEDESEEEEAG